MASKTRNRADRRKVLIVHSTLHIGGAEEVTAHLCNRIDHSRYDVRVCYLKEKGVVGERIERRGTPVISVAKEPAARPDYLTALRLRRVVRIHGFELVHSHDVHALVDCSLCRLSMPSLRFVHTFHYGNYPNRDTSLRRLESLCWRVPDRLISVSDAQKFGLNRLYGIPPSRVTTVYNGVEVAPASARFPDIISCRKRKCVVIGSINTLIEQKGMFDLLLVAQLLKQRRPGSFMFLVAGDGHLRPELERAVRDSGLEQEVRFLGWVENGAQVFLPQVDIFFQPSLWEAMSMVLLEAMACGKAIVATGVGETPLILQDGVHGRIVAPKDIEAMVNSLERLIGDPDLRIALGENARQAYTETFTAQKMAQRYERIYESLLN